MLISLGNITEMHLNRGDITQYYESQLCHYGIKGMKKGVRRFQNADGTLTPVGKARYYGKKSSTVKSIEKRMSDTLASSYKKPKISGREYDLVLSALMTDMTRSQRSELVISKHFGDCLYTLLKRDDGEYDIINKKKL